MLHLMYFLVVRASLKLDSSTLPFELSLSNCQDQNILSSELEVNGYDLVRHDQSKRGGGVACYIYKLDFIQLQRQFLQ